MRKSLFILILIGVLFFECSSGHAKDKLQYTEQWSLLFHDSVAKVFINEPSFKSNVQEMKASGQYSMDVWIYIEEHGRPFNVKQNWKFQTDITTGKTQGLLLYNKAYDKNDQAREDLGGITNRWDDVAPGSFLDKVTAEAFKYDLATVERFKQEQQGASFMGSMLSASISATGGLASAATVAAKPSAASYPATYNKAYVLYALLVLAALLVLIVVYMVKWKNKDNQDTSIEYKFKIASAVTFYYALLAQGLEVEQAAEYATAKGALITHYDHQMFEHAVQAIAEEAIAYPPQQNQSV